jgi:hypothetical protein
MIQKTNLKYQVIRSIKKREAIADKAPVDVTHQGFADLV